MIAWFNHIFHLSLSEMIQVLLMTSNDFILSQKDFP